MVEYGQAQRGFMEWLHALTIIVSLGGMMYWFKMDLQKHIDRIDQDAKGQAERIDRLYQMFVDLLKAKG